jgi:uncharacterized protein YozE (UPF0346 family)
MMGTITKIVQQHMEWFRPKQMILDELTPPQSEDKADYFDQRDKNDGTSEMRVPAIVQLQMNDDAFPAATKTFREVLVYLETVARISQMLQQTSQPGGSHIRLGSVKLQSHMSSSGIQPTSERNTSPLLKVKPVEPESFYLCK